MIYVDRLKARLARTTFASTWSSKLDKLAPHSEARAMRSSGAAGQTELIPPKHQKRGVKALAVALDPHSVHQSANQSAKRLRNNEHWPISPPVAASAVVMGATCPDLYAAVGLPVGGRSPYRVRGHAWRCGATRPAVNLLRAFPVVADLFEELRRCLDEDGQRCRRCGQSVRLRSGGQHQSAHQRAAEDRQERAHNLRTQANPTQGAFAVCCASALPSLRSLTFACASYSLCAV